MYKLISAKYDTETMASIVTIGTDLGIFEGIVTIREEDVPYASRYFGCELAELKAYINYAKAKMKYYRAQKKALVDFFKTMKDTRTWDAEAYYVYQLDRHIQEVNDNYHRWKRIVNQCNDSYHKLVIDRDKANLLLKKFSKVEEKQNNA